MPNRPGIAIVAALAATTVAATVVVPASAASLAGRTRPAGTVAAAGVRPTSVPAQFGPGSVPAGFRPGSASFVSAETGYVLGAVNCKPGAKCKSTLVTTGNAGASWRVVPAPRGATTDENVLFSGPRTGWVWGYDGLWVTRNSGGSWRTLRPGGPVMSLAAGSAAAYAIVVLPRKVGETLFSSPTGRNAWHRVTTVGPGQPESVIAAFGKSAWFSSGSTLWKKAAGSPWKSYPFACAKTGYQLSGIAAASPSLVYFLCLNSNSAMGHERMEVMVSANGGRTEQLAGGKSPVIGDGGLLAVPPGNPSVLTFASSPGIPSFMARSVDGGKTWKQVGSLFGDGPWDSLQYVTRTAGWIVLGRAGLGGAPELLHTTDAGRSWHQVSF
jgi:hypothetical protein